MILEGNVSVKAAIMAGRRKVEKLYIAKDKHDKDSMYILHRAEDKGIEIIRPERQVIDDMAQGRTHGGLVAVAEIRAAWADSRRYFARGSGSSARSRPGAAS